MSGVDDKTPGTPGLDRKRSYATIVSPVECNRTDHANVPSPTRWKGSPHNCPPETEPRQDQAYDLTQLVLSAVSSEAVIQALTATIAPLVTSIVECALKPISETFQSQFDEMKSMNSELASKIETQNGKIEGQNKQIEALKSENRELWSRLRSTDNEVGSAYGYIDELEQYGRRTSLRFHGVPVDANKSTDEIIVDICNNKICVDPKISENDINRSHTIGKVKDGKCQIICKFRNWKIKNSVYMSKKNLKAVKTDDFKVFVSEDLTRRRQSLVQELSIARQDGRVHSYWTIDGRIFAKQTEKGKKILLKSIEDIDYLLPRPEGDLISDQWNAGNELN